MRRRRYLQATALALTGRLAGCSELGTGFGVRGDGPGDRVGCRQRVTETAALEGAFAESTGEYSTTYHPNVSTITGSW